MRPFVDGEETITQIVMKFGVNDSLTLYRKTIRENLKNFEH